MNPEAAFNFENIFRMAREAIDTPLHPPTEELNDRMIEFEQILDRLRSDDPTLISLNLDNYRIGNDGVYRLCNALTSNHSLTSLVLGSNIMNAEGAGHLAKMLEFNTSLMSLNLGNNNIGDVGVRCIETALINNASLTSLNLRQINTFSEIDNPIRRMFAVAFTPPNKQVEELLERNKHNLQQKNTSLYSLLFPSLNL